MTPGGRRPGSESLAERFSYAAYATGWATVRRVPRPVADATFRAVADAAWRRDGQGVRQLAANLRRVRPDAGPEELRQLTRQGMRSYMRYWMESFRMASWSRRQILDAVEVDGIENLLAALDSGRGAVVALPHMANWDLAGAWIATRGHRFTTVAERLRPERLFERFVAHREGLGMEVLPLTGNGRDTITTLARRLREGRLVCLPADRDLGASGVPVRFFGEEARMPPGPASLARQTGAALLPATLWYDGPLMRCRVHPEVTVPEPGTAPGSGDGAAPAGAGAARRAQVAAMTQAMADAFAEGVAAHPQDWHMLQPLWNADVATRAARRAGAADPGQEGTPAR
ncbi:phosphatidylinositol mannoside acyltransferase [Allostreptomyces psammosilenae]|uniref:KDO2-lipid IV(A) lauroyltransferase n=1 Tax=Allostreptomyces psammosilenae TaxID=1892865 RepID=A0A853A3E1_9ACTN|nr:phosphatidylinositol mannoside acyltransferase [Allostreptomyces psammosilenae]NYI05032.1 KDO2-lipid IV(A) lauroyltransferase [Allostreptomyces psammosilenae]